MSDEFPLQGLRVVDASQGIAGPSAAMMLARYGADVIKVEPPNGDWSRHKGFNAERIAAQAVSNNLGKRSLAVDLKHPDGALVLRRLLAGADIFIESFRPGVIERLGFGYEQVTGIRKDIVYVSISGFGQEGPWREKGALDVVMQAFSGLMSVNRGAEDGLPHRIGFQLIDVVTGLYAFQAILVAVYARRDSGCGRHIDCSLLQSATAVQALPILLYSAGARGDAALNSSPLGTFRTSDGWINLGVTKDTLWPPFCRVIHRPDLADDSSLATAAQRRARRSEITAMVAEIIARDTTDAWAARLSEAGILNERVHDYSALLHHPQVDAVRAFSWIDQPDLGRVAVANPPGAAPLPSGSPLAVAPHVGSHTRGVLQELGYEASEIEALLKSGAVAAR